MVVVKSIDRLVRTLTCALALVSAVAATTETLRAGDQKVQASAPGQNFSSIRKPSKSVRLDLYGDPLPEHAIARMGTLRFRHPGWLHRILFSPDGKVIASADSEEVRFWDASSGLLLRRLVPGHEIKTMAMSRDGKRLALAGRDRPLRGRGELSVWDFHSGAAIARTRDLARGILVVDFSPDGSTIAAGDFTGNIGFFDADSGKKTRQVHAFGMVFSLAYAPGGKTLASWDLGEQIRIWDVSSGTEIRSTDAKENSANYTLAFSPDGTLLAWGGNWDEQIHVWRPGDDRVEPSFWGVKHTPPGLSAAQGVAFSPDGHTLAATDNDGLILWDVATRGQRLRLRLSGVRDVAVAFSPDGRFLASCGRSVVHVWDAASGELVSGRRIGHSSNVVALAFSLDGQTLVTGGAAPSVLGWDAATGRPKFCLSGCANLGALAVAPDGQTVATAGWDDSMRVWDVRTGKLRWQDKHWLHPGTPALVFRPQDGFLVAAIQRGSIRTWKMPQGVELRRCPLSLDDVRKRPPAQRDPNMPPTALVLCNSFRFSADGRWLASYREDTNAIYVVDANTGHTRQRIEGPQAFDGVAVSPDGRLVAAFEPSRIRIWEALSGKQCALIERTGARFFTACFSPDGKTLASSEREDGTIRLWEVATAREVLRLDSPDEGALALLFSPDGRRLASGSWNSTATVWDVTTSTAR
jgi:WD40 repeat protein